VIKIIKKPELVVEGRRRGEWKEWKAGNLVEDPKKR